MKSYRLVVMGLLTAALSLSVAGQAFAQAGLACNATTGVCGLGGQLRAQIGSGLPLPISFAPGATGFFYSQPGQIAATPNAQVVMEVPAPATGPRSLMVPVGAFKYDAPQFGIPVLAANPLVLSVRTDLTYSVPGTAFGTATYSAGGRSGPAIVDWCAGILTAGPGLTFDPGCLSPSELGTTIPGVGTEPLTNGLITFTATRNQFGGNQAQSKVGGTAMVYFNAGGKGLGDLPCTFDPVADPTCIFARSDVIPNPTGVQGGPFSNIASNSAFATTMGVFAAQIGTNGTVIQTLFALPTPNGTPVAGPFIPFTGQGATSWGVPQTTGMLTISVTQNLGDDGDEIFIRTGGDGRDADGNGVITLVTGAVSARDISGPNGNRGWATLRVPEPTAIAGAGAGLLALLGAHQIARRRRS